MYAIYICRAHIHVISISFPSWDFSSCVRYLASTSMSHCMTYTLQIGDSYWVLTLPSTTGKNSQGWGINFLSWCYVGWGNLYVLRYVYVYVCICIYIPVSLSFFLWVRYLQVLRCGSPTVFFLWVYRGATLTCSAKHTRGTGGDRCIYICAYSIHAVHIYMYAYMHSVSATHFPFSIV